MLISVLPWILRLRGEGKETLIRKAEGDPDVDHCFILDTETEEKQTETLIRMAEGIQMLITLDAETDGE